MTDGPATADTARLELLGLAREALARLAPDLPVALSAPLLGRLFADLPDADLATEPPEALAAAVAGLLDLARQRAPGEAKVRVLPPGPGRGPHAVAEIVTDDMPFLVDSALVALARQGRVVRQLLHPVLPATRDAEGVLTALDAPGGRPESMMRIAIAAAPAPMLAGPSPAGDWAALEAAITHGLRDVKRAVDDFPDMAAMLRTATGAAGADTPEGAFLQWMAADNFVLLGHRRLAIGADGAVTMVAAENRGLLRDAALPVFDALRDLDHLPPPVRAAMADPRPLAVAKANMRSTVHRPQHADVVAVRVEGTDGRATGVRLFLGLFAASAYNRNPRSIPWLGQKVDRILAAAGFEPEGHDGRALRNILDTWPRDELFQASEREILKGARRALDLQLRPRTALVVRRDAYGRFVSAIAWLPRDTFDTRLRERVGQMLARGFGGRLSAYYIALGDAPLARVHYIVATDPAQVAAVDEAMLEAAIAQAARGFQDRLAEALTAERGEAAAAALLSRWRDAFPAGYRDGATGAEGAADLALAERALAEGRPAAMLDRAPGAGTTLRLRLANPGGPLPLADALPLFESLDLRAIEEVPHRLSPTDGPPLVLHVFTLAPGAAVEPARFPALLEALSALLDGRAEADGFNRLVLRAGIGWREAWLLRAMYRWLKQVGFGFSQPSVEAALAAHPRLAWLLVRLFATRFDPDFPGDRAAEEAALTAEWTAAMDAIEDPDEERILARTRVLLDAMLRTNFYQDHARLAFKLDSAAAGEMPSPRPWREIFVHSPRMEGTHLRAGPVARGGIRWSDRREDFRAEILGLMKAQRVKNVVIVPTGAKGGFILKHPPPASDRAAFQAEGRACYAELVRGMLDLTDNLAPDGSVAAPSRVVRRDGEDPYIVAAADKGTATFSDLANGLSAEYGFWLGDAFASGGSAGYDHKGMGITARGAWVMIARHFAEMGHDIQAEAFTCAGVGDMSGDVFGNGLLVSRKTRLVAAFDHRHIFLDPDPDPEASFAERQRLFALPTSSWADYDAARISAGGGVFPRNQRSIPLSPQMRLLLGIAEDRAEPNAVIRAILRAEVDLLYFGGIGTYVKSSTESNAEAADRANDAIRIDGRDLRARVVGEGANLGVTQAGRIEYATQGAGGAGGRINSDALDNSAGVSTSDHEVNIKILLADAEREGALTRPQRDALLVEMTDEVAALVLRDNALQALAVSLEEAAGSEALPAQARLMTLLERAGVLDRAVAGLPGEAAMQARIASGQALSRPEIAALLPLAKLWLTETIADSSLPDDPAFLPMLVAYFPTVLRERFGAQIARHKLRRDLVATAIANRVVNRLGCVGLLRLAADAGPIATARAAWLAGAAFRLEQAYDAADAAAAPAAVRIAVIDALRGLHQAVAEGLLGGDAATGLEAALAALRPGMAALREAAAPEDSKGWIAAGIPAEVAMLAAAAQQLAAAPVILRLAAQSGAAPAEAAAAWAAAGAAFLVDALRTATLAASAPGAFGPRARTTLLADIDAAQARLAAAALAGAGLEPLAQERVVALVREAVQAGDLAAATVAARALGDLA